MTRIKKIMFLTQERGKKIIYHKTSKRLVIDMIDDIMYNTYNDEQVMAGKVIDKMFLKEYFGINVDELLEDVPNDKSK